MDLFTLVEEMGENPGRMEWLLAMECAVVLFCLALAWMLPIVE